MLPNPKQWQLGPLDKQIPADLSHMERFASNFSTSYPVVELENYKKGLVVLVYNPDSVVVDRRITDVMFDETVKEGMASSGG